MATKLNEADDDYGKPPFRIGEKYDMTRDELEDAAGHCVAVVWTRRAKSPGGGSHESNYKDCPKSIATANILIRGANCHADLVRSLEECLAIVQIQNGNLHADTNAIQARAAAALAAARKEPQ